MTFDPREFMIRRPRHTAGNTNLGRVWLKAVCEPPVEPQQVQLVDFSRRGAQLEMRSPVPPNCEIVLQVEHEELGLSIEIPGDVRWQRTRGAGEWSAGCHFKQLVPYEAIGEMFLSGVLSTACPADP